jgi:hypothetical protein
MQLVCKSGFVPRVAVIAAAVALGAGVAGCGSSSSSSSSSSSRSSSATTSSAAPATSTSKQPAAAGGGAAVTTGPVRATFRGANHAPKATKPWNYSIHVTNASGAPLSGTVEIEFTFGGRVVGKDTPPVHPVRGGVWHDYLQFPSAAVGQPLAVQAVVHTSAGSVTLRWPVTVTP